MGSGFVGLGVLVGFGVGTGVGVGKAVGTGVGVPYMPGPYVGVGNALVGTGVAVGVGVKVPSCPFLPGKSVVIGTRLLFPFFPSPFSVTFTTLTVGVGV